MSETIQSAQDDTRVHVAQLLQEQVGAVRQRRIAIEALPLDDGMAARDVAAAVRLTRIPTGILANGQVRAIAALQCIRCLDDYEQPIVAEFADEYRPTIDILTGTEITQSATGDDDEHFSIDDLHVLDLRESIRQALVLELPMAPLCREDCPGLPEAADHLSEGDTRLAVLGHLLIAEDDNERA